MSECSCGCAQAREVRPVYACSSAADNIVLDGCKVVCGAKTFEKEGIPFRHYVRTDYGVEKGKTPVSDDLVEGIASKIAESLSLKAKA